MKKTLFLMAAAALVMSACTQDVAEKGGVDANYTGEVTFAATSQVTRTAITAGDNMLEVSWVGGEDQIGIFAYDESELAESNAVYTAAESGAYSLFTTVGEAIQWGEGSHDFYAYYPYNTEALHQTAVYADVPAVQEQSEAGDLAHIAPLAFMYASQTDVIKSAEPVDFSFQNAFSVVAVNVVSTRAEVVECSGVIFRATDESEVVTASNVCVNLIDGSLSYDSAEASNQVQVNLATPATLDAENAQTFYALITPGHAGKSFEAIALVNGEEVSLGEFAIPESGIPASALAVLDLNVPEPEPGIIDLSANGTANCYVVNKANCEYKFKATVKGNGRKILSGDKSSIAPTKARLLWAQNQTTTDPTTIGFPKEYGTSTAANLIIAESVTLGEDGYIYFKTGEEMPNGNVGIIATDDDDNILWSWHLWVVKGYDPAATDINVQTKGVNTYFMDRNIGAFVNYATVAAPDNNTHIASRGLYYQWGRKDPFIGHQSARGYATKALLFAADGSSSALYSCYGGDAVFQGVAPEDAANSDDINDIMAWTAANPLRFIKGTGSNGYTWVATTRSIAAAEDAEWTKLWGNPALDESLYDKGGVKTMHDPCPVGYRVPSTGHFTFITSHGDQSSNGYGNNLRNWQFNSVEKIYDADGNPTGKTDTGWAKSAPFGLHFYANGVKTASPDAQNGVQDYGVLPADQESVIYFPAQGWIPYGFTCSSNENELQYQTNRPAKGNINCNRMMCSNDGNFYYGWTKVNWGQAMGLPVRCVRDEAPYVEEEKEDIEFSGSTGTIQ